LLAKLLSIALTTLNAWLNVLHTPTLTCLHALLDVTLTVSIAEKLEVFQNASYVQMILKETGS